MIGESIFSENSRTFFERTPESAENVPCFGLSEGVKANARASRGCISKVREEVGKIGAVRAPRESCAAFDSIPPTVSLPSLSLSLTLPGMAPQHAHSCSGEEEEEKEGCLFLFPRQTRAGSPNHTAIPYLSSLPPFLSRGATTRKNAHKKDVRRAVLCDARINRLIIDFPNTAGRDRQIAAPARSALAGEN